jgi:hypothetical protein
MKTKETKTNRNEKKWLKKWWKIGKLKYQKEHRTKNKSTLIKQLINATV